MAKLKLFDGEKVRSLRMKKELSTATLALKIGCSTTYLFFIEANEREPSLEIAYKLATSFGLTIDELIKKA